MMAYFKYTMPYEHMYYIFLDAIRYSSPGESKTRWALKCHLPMLQELCNLGIITIGELHPSLDKYVAITFTSLGACCDVEYDQDFHMAYMLIPIET